MRRRTAQSVLPSQAAGRAGGLAGELPQASELLLRSRGVPDAGDTAIGAIPRPPGVPGSSGGARVGAATRAVHRVLEWYRRGEDVQLLLPRLVTYMGHRGLESTQRYLSLTPAVLVEASARFEKFAAPIVPVVEVKS